MEVVVSENENFISIHITQPEGKSLSWEELQSIKDDLYKDLDFIEVYPKENEIINNANERHLIHIKGWVCVKMGDLEKESCISFLHV